MYAFIVLIGVLINTNRFKDNLNIIMNVVGIFRSSHNKWTILTIKWTSIIHQEFFLYINSTNTDL